MNTEFRTICILDGDLADRLVTGLNCMADLLAETLRRSRLQPLQHEDIAEPVMACAAAQDDIMQTRGDKLDPF